MEKENFCDGRCAGCERFTNEQKGAEGNFDWEKEQRRKEESRKEHEDVEKVNELLKKLTKEEKEHRKKKRK